MHLPETEAVVMPPPTHLIVRKDGILCCVCCSLEPVHPGDGTTMDTLLLAFDGVMRRHPAKEHGDPFKASGGRAT